MKELWAEPIQEIKDEDIVAEGGMWRESGKNFSPRQDREGFANWWTSVHSKSWMAWANNPWVWAIKFEIVRNLDLV